MWRRGCHEFQWRVQAFFYGNGTLADCICWQCFCRHLVLVTRGMAHVPNSEPVVVVVDVVVWCRGWTIQPCSSILAVAVGRARYRLQANGVQVPGSLSTNIGRQDSRLSRTLASRVVVSPSSYPINDYNHLILSEYSKSGGVAGRKGVEIDSMRNQF